MPAEFPEVSDHSPYQETNAETHVQYRRGDKVLVIHPGSRFVRIGRASDVAPVTIPHVLARKVREPPAVPPVSTECIFRPQPAEGPLTEGKLNVAKGDPVGVTLRYLLRISHRSNSG